MTETGTPAPEGAGGAGGGPRPRVSALTRSLRFDGGGLALDLVATLGRRHGDPVERLDGPGRLGAWCEGVSVRLEEGEATEALVAELRLLREAAYDVASAGLRGTVPALTSVALVNECAHHEPPAPRLESGPEGVVVARPALTGRQLRSLVARDLIALMADPVRRAGLRECAGPHCRMLYLDGTPGRRRVWCSMRRCGNSAKAARHRGRAAADPA
ncbi:CGNR zinc finger domain-containing protein [Actinacidiphila acidipaludis]|uniref:ABATE domain-containing protein n=1 Tax=Actinacidiphila acidipaludis TaxID=2873382 RepID=A0ABS7Q7A0_9ACTN|nr:CGNR zinc finger domain-containing protein [Streptomyces acidipaludis]MBY8878808.1 ABATE domain-containing protein [Streptomyces acidipaludis]